MEGDSIPPDGGRDFVDTAKTREALEQLRAIFATYPFGIDPVDVLIAERRAEARRENAG